MRDRARTRRPASPCLFLLHNPTTVTQGGGWENGRDNCGHGAPNYPAHFCPRRPSRFREQAWSIHPVRAPAALAADQPAAHGVVRRARHQQTRGGSFRESRGGRCLYPAPSGFVSRPRDQPPLRPTRKSQGVLGLTGWWARAGSGTAESPHPAPGAR